MMLPIRLGVDLQNENLPVCLEPDRLSRHLHCIGATGTGKTVAIHTLLRPILSEPREKAAVFIIDPMGNLSHDLLLWISSRRCPEHVRRRLLYIEPARSEYVVPFNPLRLVTDENRYYHAARAVDLILRAWSAQDLMSQPRLMQWSYKAMAVMASLRLPIAMSRYLLHPGTQEHKALLKKIPESLEQQWSEILNAKGGEPTRILESTRNRFDPFYEAPQARRMFGTFESRFDVEQCIRDRRIVILNVAKLGKLPRLLGSTIGSLVANEVFETVFNMATTRGRKAVEPTYLLLDECQMFVSPDIEDAIPTCRQMGLRLILAHQSFSQLQQGDIDMSNIIWQARNRLMFANSSEDADLIAEELATLTFDPMHIKDQRTSLKQLIIGYRIEWLESEGVSRTHADSAMQQQSFGYSRGHSEAHRLEADGMLLGNQSGHTHGTTSGGTHADSESTSHTRSQHPMPVHKTIEEVSNVTYKSFDEHRQEWRKIVRELETGVAFGRFVDDPHLYQIGIDHNPLPETRSLEARYQELLQRNFEQPFFISADEADRLAERDRLRLLQPGPIVLDTKSLPGPDEKRPENETRQQPPDPFR